jgi:hypothetical protein
LFSGVIAAVAAELQLCLLTTMPYRYSLALLLGIGDVRFGSKGEVRCPTLDVRIAADTGNVYSRPQ